MELHSSVNISNKQTFGANYADELLPAVSNLCDRVMRITAKRNANFKNIRRTYREMTRNISPDTLTAECAGNIMKQAKKLAASNAKTFAIKSKLRYALEKTDYFYPFDELCISQKNGKNFYALRTKQGEHLLTPIRTIGNQDPKKNPESIKMSLSDLEQIGQKLQDLDRPSRIWNSIVKCLNRKIL